MQGFVLVLVVIGESVALAGGPQEVAAPGRVVQGDGVIRGKTACSEIVITTTDRLAGAIHSLTWDGVEFIDSHDHGRQLQSAASFDSARPGPFWAERFNPTEAGSRADGVGMNSTSKLLSLHVEGAELRTSSQMAFWLTPTEKSFGRPALNETILSKHVVSKRVRIGYKQMPNVIDYDVTFSVPKDERHTLGQFEALTGYMPPTFTRFWKFVPSSGRLERLSDGPGEQEHPVVFATESGSHAMGIFAPAAGRLATDRPGYGRFRFMAEKVVKWNCVFRVRSDSAIDSGDYRFRMFVAVGTLDDVKNAIETLSKAAVE